MRWFNHLSINRKLTVVMLLACTFSLLMAGTALIGAEWLTSRQVLVDNMNVLADLLGRNCAAPLSFHREEDVDEANKVLEAVEADSHIVAAGLYDKDGQKFGQYINATMLQSLPEQPPSDGHRFAGSYVEIAQPIKQGQKRIGTVFLRVDLGRIYEHLRFHAGIVGMVLALTCLIAFLLASFLRRPIAGPILALAAIAKRIAEQKDFSARAVKAGEDEIGHLTDAFNLMLSEIEAGQGSLQRANQALLGQARQLVQSVDVLTASSDGILATSMELAAGATQTATAVQETTTTLARVREIAGEACKSAESVAEGAQAVVQISVDGKQSVEETIRGMDHIRLQVESIAESMGRLSEQTQAIGEIIASVDDLAAQSNVLAVNASIEAAKAGEQGRGFMVVAQEVRQLSDQSKQATKQVRGILNDVQKAAHAAVLATEQGSKAVHVGVRQSGLSRESIQSLTQSVTGAAQTAAAIVHSSQQQLNGTDQVAQAMESILQASTQNAAGARQLEAAAHNLKRLANQLKHCLEESVQG